MKVELSSNFLKAFRKIVMRRPDAALSVLQKVLLFSQEPNSPSLRLHKLKGEMKDVWSFSVEKDLRIIVDRSDPTKTTFVDIGSHDQVY